jgi:DNA-binding MarR family transcriptional regulator
VKAEVDQILEAIIYLYTESRRITKELARRAELTGPQLTVVKMLETFGDLSLSDLSDRIRSQNSTVTRVVHIQLTEKGARIAREIPVEPMEMFRAALGTLTGTEARELLRILTKIARRVQVIVRGVGDETAKSGDKSGDKSGER